MSRSDSCGVWSEMLSDGVLLLDRSGSLDADRLINTSFLVGSPELYEWADNNPRLRMSRTEMINDPSADLSEPCHAVGQRDHADRLVRPGQRQLR